MQRLGFLNFNPFAKMRQHGIELQTKMKLVGAAVKAMRLQSKLTKEQAKEEEKKKAREEAANGGAAQDSGGKETSDTPEAAGSSGANLEKEFMPVMLDALFQVRC